MRWLAVRLDLISIALITTTGLMIVLMHGKIPPAYAGLAISYAVQVSLCQEEQPHAQGVVAARAQEGREELLHVPGQEGRPGGDTPHPR